MTREDLLKAFAQMSPEDQEFLRAELAAKAASPGAYHPMAMCRELMDKMKCC